MVVIGFGVVGIDVCLGSVCCAFGWSGCALSLIHFVVCCFGGWCCLLVCLGG